MVILMALNGKLKVKLEFSTRFHLYLTKCAGGAGLSGEGAAVIRLMITRMQRGKVQDKGPAFRAGGGELADGSWKWCTEDSSQRAAGHSCSFPV